MRFLALALTLLPVLTAAPPAVPKNLRVDGFVPYYWQDAEGKMWLEVGRWGQEFLYYTSLPSGIGSNDIGLDRGQLGASYVVRWERSGNKVLLVAANMDFRADSRDAAERQAVKDSFAESVIWGFEAAVQEDGRVLVDATAFFLRDSHGVAETLQTQKQGSYHLDASRSAFYLPRTKNFPKNTEVEATITFAGGPAGRLLRPVTPSGGAVTVRMHHSFVELPELTFQKRAFDPRSGFFDMSYADYATPVAEPVMKRFTPRHRLEKKDPSAAVSEAVKPIVYYLDPGAPEPIRGALLQGARWWNQAFEAAGFRNAFRVELLPEGADPMDVRYNVIQWVHRSTRGWSYGSSVSDPRTGEILKGHVTLGSLRVRQDFLIAESLLAPYAGEGTDPRMLEMSLARLRQLAAHEVGHTLGLGHNYIASTHDRASVMDYPHPWVTLKNGQPDLSDAYAKGIGEWDKVAITWGYSQFAPGTDEKKALNGIIDAARQRGLTFLTDQDARPAGGAHPETHLWDSGTNAVDELNRWMGVRAAALARYGENNVRTGAPLALLEDVLVPLYLSHRYQVEAAVKSVAGLRYSYALRGDGQTPTQIVAPAEQRRALEAVLATIRPEVLTLPESLIRLIPPRPAGFERTRELFRHRTGLTFDPVTAAESAANMTIDLIVNPQRAARLVEYHARDAAMPGLGEVLDRLFAVTWKAPEKTGLAGEVLHAVQYVALRNVMNLAVDEDASGQVRAVALLEINRLKAWLAARPGSTNVAYGLSEIAAFEKDPKQMRLPKAPEPPPGMPIGMAGLSCDWE